MCVCVCVCACVCVPAYYRERESARTAVAELSESGEVIELLQQVDHLVVGEPAVAHVREQSVGSAPAPVVGVHAEALDGQRIVRAVVHDFYHLTPQGLLAIARRHVESISQALEHAER